MPDNLESRIIAFFKKSKIVIKKRLIILNFSPKINKLVLLCFFMEEINYQELGFKCGLEIHQQLDTKKLFCECQSVLRKDEPDFIIKRKLNAVAGESGVVDVAAEYEKTKDKEFIYQGYDTTCLVELDEEPPHEINKDALKIALQISLLLNCKILPLTQIMRKTVIDGSNYFWFSENCFNCRGWLC